MSPLSDSLARLQAELDGLAARLATLDAPRDASAGSFDANGSSNVGRFAAPDETQRAMERCAEAMERLAAALDGGRLRVVIDDPETPAARYS